MTEQEARAKAKQIAEEKGQAFLLFWPWPQHDDFWTAAEKQPSFRAPGLKAIQISGDGKEHLVA